MTSMPTMSGGKRVTTAVCRLYTLLNYLCLSHDVHLFTSSLIQHNTKLYRISLILICLFNKVVD